MIYLAEKILSWHNKIEDFVGGLKITRNHKLNCLRGVLTNDVHFALLTTLQSVLIVRADLFL